MGCKDAVIPESFSKNLNMNCLIFQRNTRQAYNDNLCLLRAFACYLHGNDELEKETSKIFNLFLFNCEEGVPSKFQSVHMSDIPKVEDLLQLNISLFDIDFADGEPSGEPCRSIQKYDKSVKLLRYNKHICCVNNTNAFFKAFQCSTCETFFSKTGNLKRHLVTSTERAKHKNPKNGYEFKKIFLEKLDASKIPHKE